MVSRSTPSQRPRPSLVIIGGGATGFGVARDAAQRGFAVTLIERGELGQGTSGHFHGLLHSGARYAVADPGTAAACYRENQVVRRIAPSAVRDTGGLFVAFDDAELAHAEVIRQACAAAGIPTADVPVEEVRAAEPHLNPAVTGAFAVPDGYVDGHALIELNERAALTADVPATVLPHHTVTGFRREGGAVTAVQVRDVLSGRDLVVPCDHVVNAAGVWVPEIARLAGAHVDMVYDQGTMVTFEDTFSTAVLNRSRPEGDGDLLVPDGAHSVMGTTSRVVAAPDDARPSDEEVALLVDEGAVLVPALASAPVHHAYAGVRPLAGGAPGGPATRQLSRGFTLIDHTDDGVPNVISLTGGKVTLYRLMAESAVDLLCRRAGIDAPCRTADTVMEAAAHGA